MSSLIPAALRSLYKDLFLPDHNARKAHELGLLQAASYTEWEAHAGMLDRLDGLTQWKLDDSSKDPDYDYSMISHRLLVLQLLVSSGDVHGAIFALREGLHRNLGHIGNPMLYRKTHSGETKALIDRYIRHVCSTLEWICRNDSVPLETRLRFFAETSASFGKTALCLSGGATLGLFHLGVCRALLNAGLLPRVISGSSVGSIVAALVCTRADEDLVEILSDPSRISLNAFEETGEAGGGSSTRSSWRRRLARFLHKGVLLDIRTLAECVRANIGDLTFEEAYCRTGRILNITVSSAHKNEVPRLMNYLTAPNALIWSAAVASCSVPFFFEPFEIVSKDHRGDIVPWHPGSRRWTDGSLHADLPMQRLSELFNVNHFIVSQANPHVIPFLTGNSVVDESLEASSSSRRPRGFFGTLRWLFLSEIKFRLLELFELGWMPDRLSVLENVITQRYVGDITIFPQPQMKNYLQMFTNPSSAVIGRYMQEGQRQTWPKLPRVRNQCAVEKTLEECLRFIKLHQEEGEGRPEREMLNDASSSLAAGPAQEPSGVDSAAWPAKPSSVIFPPEVPVEDLLLPRKTTSSSSSPVLLSRKVRSNGSPEDMAPPASVSHFPRVSSWMSSDLVSLSRTSPISEPRAMKSSVSLHEVGHFSR